MRGSAVYTRTQSNKKRIWKDIEEGRKKGGFRKERMKNQQIWWRGGKSEQPFDVCRRKPLNNVGHSGNMKTYFASLPTAKRQERKSTRAQTLCECQYAARRFFIFLRNNNVKRRRVQQWVVGVDLERLVSLAIEDDSCAVLTLVIVHKNYTKENICKLW